MVHRTGGASHRSHYSCRSDHRIPGAPAKWDSIPAAGIVAGADGNLWFSEYFSGRVGRITTEGVITVFVMEPECCADMGEITAGPDGNLWVTERTDNVIWRMSHDGSATPFRFGSGGFGVGNTAIYGITTGADGALWFTYAPSTIGRLSTDGTITSLQTPTAGGPEIITTGPDGNIWFTLGRGNKIGRIGVTELPAPVHGPRRRGARP